MSVEIENSSRQVLKRLTKIKNTIVALNPLVEFPNLSADNKLDDTATHVHENLTNHHPNNILISKGKMLIIDITMLRTNIKIGT